MKKSGILIFIAALTVGLLLVPSCNFRNLKNMSGTEGSGSAKTEQRNLSGFKKIEASGAIEIEVVTQKSFAVEVSADDNLIRSILTEVDGDTLKISSEGSISPKTKVFVKVSMPEIKFIDLSGASSGIVNNVKSGDLKIKASGASKLKIDGEVRKIDAEANGASKIDAENLRAQNVDVEVGGASTAVVSATEESKAEANGASTIIYTGEPKKLEQNSSGASSIEKK